MKQHKYLILPISPLLIFLFPHRYDVVKKASNSGHGSIRYRRSPSLIKSFLCFAIRAYYDPINNKAGYIFELCSPVDTKISAPNFVFSLYYIHACATVLKWGYQHLLFMSLIVSLEHSLAVSQGIVVSLTDSNSKGASGLLGIRSAPMTF